ncbi:hypothetical protein GLAREA_09904 [Glarea lozoyensis ATCC 20868]|uniref:Uncharacterized protein n=1 Tax=Glarea lozoyensis (strain ATCC 20868 / MF5171) TaxID=1116229 RepID=S3DQQ1_GLAL2|nr:uncharacterized protein GLAREA_09904 [Glarea lozoyensis ATCC 20868]EPE28783.1 hypothetical protein GLAREA_09904 [Glarea lozoyensis ATCC 20868]
MDKQPEAEDVHGDVDDTRTGNRDTLAECGPRITIAIEENARMRAELIEAEAIPKITMAEYRKFLQDNFPDSTRYIQYPGNLIDQVMMFQAENPGYYFYGEFSNSKVDAKFLVTFPEKKLGDDAEESSKTI